jgi:ribulose-bisphosphate carboxylase large chain
MNTDAKTEIKGKERYKAGVLKYAQMGYWDADYEPKDTDLIACFRITPQEGVDPIEAAAAVAGESSTGDLDRGLDRPADRLRPVQGPRPTGSIRFPVIRRASTTPSSPTLMGLFEEGSIANVFTSLIGNVFGFKALRALRLEDVRFPLWFTARPVRARPHGIQVEREQARQVSAVRSWAATIKPKLGLSAKNYGRAGL